MPTYPDGQRSSNRALTSVLHTFCCGNTYITWNLPSLSLVFSLVFLREDLAGYPRLTWNTGIPCLHRPRASITGMCPTFLFILRNATSWHELHFHRCLISTTTSHRNSLNFTKMKFCILPPGLWDHFSILYLGIFSSLLRDRISIFYFVSEHPQGSYVM